MSDSAATPRPPHQLAYNAAACVVERLKISDQVSPEQLRELAQVIDEECHLTEIDRLLRHSGAAT